jgi:hypothetical protein
VTTKAPRYTKLALWVSCLTASIITLLSATSGSARAVVDAAQKSDCSGRIKFLLPGEFEVASVPYETLRRRIATFTDSAGFAFIDKEAAGDAKVEFVGSTLISEELDEIQLSKVVTAFEGEKDRRKKNRAIESRRPFEIASVPNIANNFYAWSVGSEVRLFFRLQNRMYLTAVDGSDELAENARSAIWLSKNIRSRAAGSIPSKGSICLPYSSANARGGSHFWQVATLYKLKAHPDVTIMVSDAALRADERLVKSREKSEKFLINDFWGQNTLGEDVGKIERGFPTRNGQAISLANQKGLASYVKIFRKNGTEDFGYYGLAQGNPSDTASADIAVSVITNAREANAKGIKPVTQDEFLRMVERFQESITLFD